MRTSCINCRRSFEISFDADDSGVVKANAQLCPICRPQINAKSGKKDIIILTDKCSDLATAMFESVGAGNITAPHFPQDFESDSVSEELALLAMLQGDVFDKVTVR